MGEGDRRSEWGITTLKPMTEEEMEEMDRREKEEARQAYHEREAEKNQRIADNSLDPDNKKTYAHRAEQQRKKAEQIAEKPLAEKTKQKEESEPINGADVKSEYDKNATPGKGKITFDKRFKDKKYAKNHQNEIDFANWLYEYYGGDIHLLGESTDQGVKSPDYLWNNRFWDLKKNKHWKSCK